MNKFKIIREKKNGLIQFNSICSSSFLCHDFSIIKIVWILEILKSNYFRIITEFSSGKFTEHFLSYQSINKLADKIETLIKKLKWLAILIRLINIIQYIQIILFSTTIINNNIDRSIDRFFPSPIMSIYVLLLYLCGI